jgi:D-tyrosyl-tRNA(Tyr) deacylase
VDVGDECAAEIGKGLLVLLGVEAEDGEAEAERLARKAAELRIFDDAEGLMNRSVIDVAGEALVVSQFTLAAQTKKGRRPSFTTAAPPDRARSLYEHFVKALGRCGVPTQTGRFRERMKVHLVNDGPVTFLLEIAAKKK